MSSKIFPLRNHRNYKLPFFSSKVSNFCSNPWSDLRSGLLGLWSRAKLRDCDSLNINQSPLCRINNRRYGEETEYQERVVQWYRAAAQKVNFHGSN